MKACHMMWIEQNNIYILDAARKAAVQGNLQIHLEILPTVSILARSAA